MTPWKVLRGNMVVSEHSNFATALAEAQANPGYTVYYENNRGTGTPVWP